MLDFHFLNLEYFFQKLYEILTGQFIFGTGSLNEFLDSIRFYSTLLSLIFLIAIIYVTIQLHRLREEEALIYSNASLEDFYSSEEEVKNERWERIVEHIDSENPSDWRLAILEADIILGEMLESMSYHGETIADKLKQIEKSDFLTIDKAWEAHKVRNAIAHDGGNFIFTEREARRIVSLYEDVFKEFKYI